MLPHARCRVLRHCHTAVKYLYTTVAASLQVSSLFLFWIPVLMDGSCFVSAHVPNVIYLCADGSSVFCITCRIIMYTVYYTVACVNHKINCVSRGVHVIYSNA